MACVDAISVDVVAVQVAVVNLVARRGQVASVAHAHVGLDAVAVATACSSANSCGKRSESC